MATDTIQLSLELLPCAASTSDDIDMRARQLRNELEELPGAPRFRLGTLGAAPQGTKSLEWVEVGKIVGEVSLLLLPKIVEFLIERLGRGTNEKVKITTVVGGRTYMVECSPKTMTPKELRKLLNQLTGLA